MGSEEKGQKQRVWQNFTAVFFHWGDFAPQRTLEMSIELFVVVTIRGLVLLVSVVRDWRSC